MDQNYQFEIEEWDPCEEIQRLIETNPWAWQSIGALSGLVGGVLCPVLGTLLIGATHFIAREGVVSSLNVLIIVCFALIIPLLAFGAHCLDLLERQAAQASLVEEQQSNRTSVGLHEVQPDNHPYFKPTAACVAFLCLVFLPTSGNAQQTIFNVPTTDVLERGEVYFELDISAKPNEPRFSSFVPRVVVGTGKRVEVGLNLTGNIQPGLDSTALVPTLKYKFYDGGNNGYAMVVGNNLVIPIRNRSYDLGNYFYVNGSKSYNKTRLTVGGYHFSSNVVAPNAHRAGVQFGFEQTISPGFTIAADWITGRHASGYLTPGVIFKPHPRVTGYASYSLGNSNLRNGNHFLLLESGFTLN